MKAQLRTFGIEMKGDEVLEVNLPEVKAACDAEWARQAAVKANAEEEAKVEVEVKDEAEVEVKEKMKEVKVEAEE